MNSTDKIQQLRNQFEQIMHIPGRSKEKATTLARIIGEAYRIDPIIANEMWNNAIGDSKSMYRSYYLVSIYRRLVDCYGIDEAVDILSLDSTRVKESFQYAHANTNLGFRAFEIIATLIPNEKYNEAITVFGYLRVNHFSYGIGDVPGGCK